MKIAVFFHAVFSIGDPPEFRGNAFEIIREQMMVFQNSGLADAASEIIIGLNGPESDVDYANLLVPAKSKIVLHGEKSFAENLTIIEIEKWVKTHPDWLVWYHHCKGISHDPNAGYASLANRWRRCMQRHMIEHWQIVASDLVNGYETAGCHLMLGVADGTQNIYAGGFWAARSSYLQRVPSMFLRERIKQSGIAAKESRYESEVWLLNTKPLPRMKDYVTDHGLTGCP